MLFSSIALLLLAAVLHAVGNALMKQARDKLAFAWWMLSIFCLFGFPVLFYLPEIPLAGWIIVILSGTLEVVYFLTLSRAYTHGDLSVVYPIARGTAPLFLLCWAALFLGERPSRWGLLGILSVVAGLYLINLKALHEWKRPLLGFKSAAARWALVTGLLISTYSAVDKVGVTYFSPFVYLYLILLVCWAGLSLQWLVPIRRDALLAEVGLHSAGNVSRVNIKAIATRTGYVLTAALLGTVGYLLVLKAMQISPVSYVAPVREVGVVFGAWIGVRYLQEKGGRLRVTASLFVAAGILLIAFGG